MYLPISDIDSLSNVDSLDFGEVEEYQLKIDGSYKERALTAERKLRKLEEKLAWINVCAEEIVMLFPKMTIKNVWTMGKAIEALKDAVK